MSLYQAPQPAVMNPFQMQRSIPVMSQQYASVTKFYDASTTQPGQPGVFEINPVFVASDVPLCQRFSFWDGAKWAAPSISVEGAYELRFTFAIDDDVVEFRGLTEEVRA